MPCRDESQKDVWHTLSPNFYLIIRTQPTNYKLKKNKTQWILHVRFIGFQLNVLYDYLVTLNSSLLNLSRWVSYIQFPYFKQRAFTLSYKYIQGQREDATLMKHLHQGLLSSNCTSLVEQSCARSSSACYASSVCPFLPNFHIYTVIRNATLLLSVQFASFLQNTKKKKSTY